MSEVTWGGAQWLLAAYLVAMTVITPMFRFAIFEHAPEIATAVEKWDMQRGGRRNRTWPEFWTKWLFELIGRLVLVLILRWGGFW
jgi:hypothetical protein